MSTTSGESSSSSSFSSSDVSSLSNKNVVEDTADPTPKKKHFLSLGLSDATATKLGYIMRHPYLRLLVAIGLVFLNFGIYAEDPVAHAHTEANIPIVGHDIAFVLTKYPTDDPEFIALKVVMWLLGLLSGILLGRFLFHDYILRDKLRLKMFQGDKGSWMIMFLTTLPVLAAFSLIYSAMLPERLEDYRISGAMSIKDQDFMKVAAIGTWLGDFITAFMVIDMMLQDTQFYPNWAPWLRRWWGGNGGKNRIVFFWVLAIVSTGVVVSGITTDFIDWDEYNGNWLPTNELSRGVLAGAITFLDLAVVIQDWEFPYFTNPFDIKLPGLPVSEINWQFLERFDSFKIHITGKWFNYGIIFIVMLLDLNMLKNQVIYEPYVFGQYTGPHDHIYTVEDSAVIDASRDNRTLLSFDARRGFDDERMNAKYKDFSYGVKLIAVIPVLVAFILFVYLTAWGRRVKKDDTHRQMHTAADDSGWSREMQPIGAYSDADHTSSSAASSSSSSAGTTSESGSTLESSLESGGSGSSSSSSSGSSSS